MSKIFGADGTNTILSVPDTSAQWSISGFAQKGEYQNLLLYSFALNDQEAVDIRRCFNDVSHVYAFGRDLRMSVLQVNLMLFLGKICPERNKVTIKDLRDKYGDIRVYKNDSTVQVTIDTLTLDCFLTAMDIGQVSPQTNSCVITLTFLIDQET